jgi:hypothetical protein
MNHYDTGNLSYSRRLRDTVIVIHVTRWVEAAIGVAGFFMVIGLLELLERMR